LDPVDVDPDSRVRGPVADPMPIPHFDHRRIDHQGVEVDDRVDLL
jgi:hypothetical protein